MCNKNGNRFQIAVLFYRLKLMRTNFRIDKEISDFPRSAFRAIGTVHRMFPLI